MSDFLASLLAKAAIMVLEALLARLIHALITTFARTAGVTFLQNAAARPA
ncbi:hypothetical protein GCM10010149_29210 [Nonomuraea roseoviolacea subsp. roseoviolacea]|uniref:Uncharacterized protein n=1 Tax=Nonomuraea roseoviolacea subsp. carminata TaxID=160689 RepID=A0ABT1K3J4_9ACTN|nr:hypothetical protein [Nonomuraea roseoviolacea]MCP2348563.1 hypothetical protein [Nonomuraea roseoviolacea subsp. carminata]